jgi:hypothetical protein
VFQIELEILKLQKIDTLTPYLKIGEVIEFPRWLIAKQNLGKNCCLKTGLYNSVWTLKINTFQAQEFLQIYTLVEQVVRNTFHFGSVV